MCGQALRPLPAWDFRSCGRRAATVCSLVKLTGCCAVDWKATAVYHHIMITLFTVLALAGAPDYSDADPAHLAFERDISELCFPSGLRVTLVHDDRQPVVSVTTVIGQGGAQDAVGREGSAHLVEHLWFRAQTSQGSVQERLEDLGVTYNAYTLADATVYLSQADIAVLPDLMALEALRLEDPLAGIGAEIVEQERAIVESERQLHGFVSMDYPRFLPPGFGGNERGLRPSSSQAIAATTMDDLSDIGNSYVPATTTIQITGPVDSAAVRALVEESFSERQRNSPGGECGGRVHQVDMAPPSLVRRGPLHTVYQEVEDPIVLVGWSLPPAYGADEPMMRMVTQMMDLNLRDSLSHARFREATTGCVFVPSPVSSSLICAASVPDGANGGRILEAMTETGGSQNMSTSALLGFSRAARLGVTDILLGLDSLSPMRNQDALRDVLSNHYGGSPMWFADALGAIRDMRIQDISRFLDRWTRPQHAWLSLVVPPGADVDAVLDGRRDRSAKGEWSEPPASAERESTARGDSHRGPIRREGAVLLPAPSLPVLAEPVTVTMNNGMRLVAVQHGVVPVSHLALVVGGASSAESRLGLDAWAAEITGIDTRGFEGESPSVAAEWLATRLWLEDYGDTHVVGLSGSDVALDLQFRLLRIYAATKGRVGERSRQDARTRVRQEAHALRRDPALVQSQAQWVHVWGEDNPYAYHPGLLANRGGSVRLGKVDRHNRTLWSPQNTTLYIVGPKDPEEMISQAIAKFASWDEEGRWKGWGDRATPTPVPGHRVSYELTDELRTTATLRFRCRAPDGTPAEVVEVAMGLLREWSHVELRESEIAAYSPSVWARQVGGATVISSSVTVDPSRAAAAATAMDSGLGWLSDDVTDVDTHRVGLRLRAGWTGRFVQTSDVLDQLMEHGEELPIFAETGGERLIQVDAEQVHAVARACSQSAALSVVSPQVGVVAESSWADVLTEASLPRGM